MTQLAYSCNPTGDSKFFIDPPFRRQNVKEFFVRAAEELYGVVIPTDNVYSPLHAMRYPLVYIADKVAREISKGKRKDENRRVIFCPDKICRFA